MAAKDPIKDLCQEAICSICLDHFRDPVTIPECGHDFCRACLTRSWGEWGAQPSCPQCRGRAQEGTLRPNQLLATVVEIAKKFTPQEGRDAVANEQLSQPQEFLRGSCKDDARPCEGWDGSEVFKEHQTVVAARNGSVCQKHQEPLKLFCKNDKTLICLVCDQSKEHRNHETLPLEEASQEYKCQFCILLANMKPNRDRIVAFKGNVEKESQDLLKQTSLEKKVRVAQFRQLHLFLEEEEKMFLAQMEEVEKEVARKRDKHVAKFSEALSTLQSVIGEMEEKCQQPAGEFLQDVRSTLQRCTEKMIFSKPVTFLALKWKIWDICDINPLLEGVLKQLKDTMDSGLPLQKAKVTLDPDTAHCYLALSEDQKSVRYRGEDQALPNNPERFECATAVLGREGFRAGRHFWEVLVGSEEEWKVGVVRKSVMRKGLFSFSPEKGVWAVGKWWGRYMASFIHPCPLPNLRGKLKKIRICLNYDEGQVTFYDADQAALLFEFSGAYFSGETLLPFFWVSKNGHLTISS